jgi:hypothetical protein
MNKIFLTLAAAAALAVPARAQSEALALGARTSFDAQAAEAVRSILPEDVFAHVPACGVLDVKTIRAWTLQEAADMAAPCLKAVGQKYGATLNARPGFLASGVAGRPAVPGLLVASTIAPGSKLHHDLSYSLGRRGGLLMGQPARLLLRGELAPQAVSSVQPALRRCFLADVVRPLQSGDDFVKIYGSCLRHDKTLGVTAISGGNGLTVTMSVDRAPRETAALNGFVVVNPGTGPVRVMILARAAAR